MFSYVSFVNTDIRMKPRYTDAFWGKHPFDGDMILNKNKNKNNSQKNFYKAALDANDIPPEITRQLGAWAQVAGDTPYSRLNEAKIDEARKRITNSNNRFLEITW